MRLAFTKAIKVGKDLIIVIPALHLSLCFYYLYLYFASFGSNLALFSNPADIFSVSFFNIAPFYAGLIIQPLIVLIPVWNLEAPEDPSKIKPMTAFDKIMYCSLPAIGAIIAIVYLVETGFFPVSASFLATAMGMWWFAKVYLRRRRPMAHPLLIATLFALALLSFNAIRDGQRDRYGSPAEFKANAQCGDLKVLRTLGDEYLVVDPAGKRWLIDQTCKRRFLIGLPNPNYFPDSDVRELTHRVRRSWGL